MPQVSPMRWRDGSGWIILASGMIDPSDPDSPSLDIAAQALTRIARGEPLAYIWAAGDIESADAHLDLLEDLGAPTGFLLDILTEDDDTIRAQLKDAGMIILGDGSNPDRLRSALVGAAQEAMINAFDRDCVILAIGAGAEILGSILKSPTGKGLGWVDGACILTDYTTQDGDTMRQMLQNAPGAYGLGIGEGSALVLGPRGEVEVWGNQQITVTMSRT
ncbi:MAG: hypothetical protein IAE83_01715 [Anaerolinea sp.]|nr:hypothetical protein [Anaerolinea sp.]MCC6975776.1 hypothetical protein [Anaerolineae bacterium]CAG0951283.1 hypothetical protein ANRL4_00085 [Anaerolineae bacterium]